MSARTISIFIVLFFISIVSFGATYYWVGTNSDWNDRNNWNERRVPTVNDDVIIDADNYTVAPEITNNVTVGSVTLQDNATLNVLDGGTLNVRMSGGRRSTPGSVTVNNSTLNIDGGVMNVQNDMWATNSTINLIDGIYNGDDVYLVNSTLNTSGDSQWNVDEFQIQGNSAVNMTENTVSDVRYIATYANSTFTFDGQSLDAQSIQAQDNSVLNMDGGVVNTEGWIIVTGDAVMNVATTLTSDANSFFNDIYLYDGGTINVNEGADISGFNNITFEPGDTDTATLNVTGGAININNDINMADATNDQINISGGEINAPGVVDFGGENNQINLTGGTLTASDVNDTNNSSSEMTDNIDNNGGTVIIGGQQVLPIELLSFTAEAYADYIDLNWATATEINNDYIEVQRSYDGVNFTVIGTLKGHGTTSEVQEYNFRDTDKHMVSNVFYRLQQFDFDGQNETFEIVRVTPIQSASISMEVYPNPATEYVKVHVSGVDESTVVLTLRNMQGHVVKSQEVDTAWEQPQMDGLDLLPTGFYVLTVEVAGQQKTQRLKVGL